MNFLSITVNEPRVLAAAICTAFNSAAESPISRIMLSVLKYVPDKLLIKQGHLIKKTDDI